MHDLTQADIEGMRHPLHRWVRLTHGNSDGYFKLNSPPATDYSSHTIETELSIECMGIRNILQYIVLAYHSVLLKVTI